MAKLNAIAVKGGNSEVRILSFEPSAIEDRDGTLYYECKLVKPIEVGCSTNPEVGKLEVDVVYMRKAIVDKGLVDETVFDGDEKDGYFIKDWVTDISKAHSVALYQETTIKSWVKGQRSERKDKNELTFQERIALLRKK